MTCIDIETYDPGISDKVNRMYDSTPLDFENENGYILGVAITTEDASVYYNLGHYDCDKETRELNIKTIKKILADDTPKIGQNIKYDIQWLEWWLGAEVNGKIYHPEIPMDIIEEKAIHHFENYVMDNIEKIMGDYE